MIYECYKSYIYECFIFVRKLDVVRQHFRAVVQNSTLTNRTTHFDVATN